MKISLLTLLLLSLLARFSQAQVGIGTTTPKAFLNLPKGKTALFGDDTTGSTSSGPTILPKLVWYGSNGAFRAGGVSGDASYYSVWDKANAGQYSFASGADTRASGSTSTAMGYRTVASADGSTAMGVSTLASGNGSTAMGHGTQASGDYSIALGVDTQASGSNSTAMGVSTEASGENSTAIGYYTSASGFRSTALGNSVSTNDKVGSFIIGDIGPFFSSNTADNQMMMRFGGGYILYTTSGFFNSQTSIGVQLASNSNAWSTLSDSTRKEHFHYADGASFLRKISTLRLGSWNYKGQDTKRYRHYGPMAQDFFAAFGHDGLGVIGDEKSINQADFDGVNLIAIQALIREVNQLRAELTRSQEREKNTQTRLDRIEAMLPVFTNATATVKP